MRSLARLGNAFQSMQARACCRRRCTLLLTEVLGVSGPPSSTSILFWQVALNVFNAIHMRSQGSRFAACVEGPCDWFRACQQPNGGRNCQRLSITDDRRAHYCALSSLIRSEPDPSSGAQAREILPMLPLHALSEIRMSRNEHSTLENKHHLDCSGSRRRSYTSTESPISASSRVTLLYSCSTVATRYLEAARRFRLRASPAQSPSGVRIGYVDLSRDEAADVPIAGRRMLVTAQGMFPSSSRPQS